MDEVRRTKDGGLRNLPAAHPGSYRPPRFSVRQMYIIRAMCRNPPHLWNRRLRRNRSLLTRVEDQEAWWWRAVQEYDRTWGPVYSKLGPRIAAADKEWDEKHEWDEEIQQWREK